MILAERAARVEAEAVAARAQALSSSTQALIAHLKLQIENLRRELYGSRSERTARLLEQMELQLEDLEASATEDELAAEKAAARAEAVKSFERKRPARKPFPEHLPRERVVIALPENCPCCGSDKLSKLGEDVTETLEVVPRQWKVIQTVREKFSCRSCEAITQPPAPFQVTPRGFAGPNLLAMILFENFGQHQPLNRQSERYAREGIDLSVSTLVDQVSACTTAAVACADRGSRAPSGCMATTPRCRSWRRARRSPGGSGPMSGTTGPLADPRRRRRSTTLRAIGGMSIPSGIFKTSAAFCRPTPIAAITRFTIRHARRGRSRQRCAGPMPGASSSNWPTLRPKCGAAGMRPRSP
jgi:transposase